MSQTLTASQGGFAAFEAAAAGKADIPKKANAFEFTQITDAAHRAEQTYDIEVPPTVCSHVA
jgi:hypothetical protein